MILYVGQQKKRIFQNKTEKTLMWRLVKQKKICRRIKEKQENTVANIREIQELWK